MKDADDETNTVGDSLNLAEASMFRNEDSIKDVSKSKDGDNPLLSDRKDIDVRKVSMKSNVTKDDFLQLLE